MPVTATPETFTNLIAGVTRRLQGREIDATLAETLNTEFSAASPAYESIVAACRGRA